VDSSQRCTSPNVARPASTALRVVLADSQKAGDRGLPAASMARLRSGRATRATPDGTARRARATSLRVTAVTGRPACVQTNSISTPRNLRRPPAPRQTDNPTTAAELPEGAQTAAHRPPATGDGHRSEEGGR